MVALIAIIGNERVIEVFIIVLFDTLNTNNRAASDSIYGWNTNHTGYQCEKFTISFSLVSLV